jgi:cytochrome bd ubiquinol oxidase subunit I
VRGVEGLTYARAQMGLSLAFHIVFAAVGVALPLLMVLSDLRWLKTRDPEYLELSKRLAKGTGILFAVGAVSGTVLSFELGLLWPGFMRYAGAIIGMPFSLEGFAFFTEAIFLGVYLYGWDRIGARAHLASGALVAVSGALSGVFVVIANAWMNSPTGFRIVGGQPVDIDPIAAMANPAALSQTIHMTIAAYASTALAVAGIHAYVLRRRGGAPLTESLERFHRAALAVALGIGLPAAILQPISGDFSARFVARWQPVKLAAMEGQFDSEAGAALRIGGWPDVQREQTRFAIEIPRGLSLLAYHDPNALVRGLRSFPRENWPPVPVVHVAFQSMVGLGTAMALVALWAGVVAIRRKQLRFEPKDRRLLLALVIVAPFGFLATEAGWFVTEVGRQPWIVFGVMRTGDAVTPMPGLVVPFLVVSLLYCGLGVVVLWLLWRQIVKTSGEFPSARYTAADRREAVP